MITVTDSNSFLIWLPLWARNWILSSFPVSDCYKIIYPPSGKSANFNSQRWNFSSKPYKRRLPLNRSGFMEIDFSPRLDLILMHRSNWIFSNASTVWIIGLTMSHLDIRTTRPDVNNKYWMVYAVVLNPFYLYLYVVWYLLISLMMVSHIKSVFHFCYMYGNTKSF